jgi:hypothetical protein
VPAPDFLIEISPAEQSIAWGQGGTFSVAVKSRNGFNAAVTLTVSDLPSGASIGWAPAAVVTPPANGSASATMTISTALAATEPGTTRFRVTGRDSQNRMRRDDGRITILRQAGAFSQNAFPLRSDNATCGPVTAVVVGVGGPRVQFSGPLGVTNPAPLFGPGYDFSPNCRVGLVLPPLGDVPFVNLFNLGFVPATGAAGINDPLNFPALAADVRFSPDDSIVAVVGPGQAQGSSALVLHDVVQRQHSTPAHFDSAIVSMMLADTRVTVITAAGQSFDVILP